MIRLVARRLGWALVVAWFAISASFALVAAIPADPARTLAGPHASTEELASVRAAYCLDQGIATRYGCYVGRIARGDLGMSYRGRRPVADLIAAHAWPTIELALAALLLQLAIGVPLGVASARRRGGLVDAAAALGGLVAASAPSFVVGSVLVWLAAYRLGAFPIQGGGEGALDTLWHLALPALTLAAAGIAYYARLVRGEVADALGSDAVRTARAKGLGEPRVAWRHALRPRLGPLVALAGADLGTLLGGAAIVETVFAWPGLGRELVLASLELDIPVILGIVLVSALAIGLANLLADVVAIALDPRLREAA